MIELVLSLDDPPRSEQIERRSSSMLHFKVQDILDFPGEGTVLTGVVESGQVTIGDPVFICSPTRKQRTRVASIEVLGDGFVKAVGEGARATLLVRGIKLDDLADGVERNGSSLRAVDLSVRSRASLGHQLHKLIGG